MNRKLIVTLLHKDIEELELITEGFMEMTEYPKAIINLAHRKTEDIQKYIQQLSAEKVDELYLEEQVQKNEHCESEKTALISDLPEQFVVKDTAVLEEVTPFAFNEPIDALSKDEIEVDEDDFELDIVDEDEFEEDTQENDDIDDIEDEDIDQDIEDEEIDEVEDDDDDEESDLEDEKLDIQLEITPIGAFSKNNQDESSIEPDVEFTSADTISIPASEEKDIVSVPPRNEILAKANNTLSASLANTKIDDIKQAISIGERFRFQRELFRGNGEDMNKTLAYINQLATLEEVMSFLQSKYGWISDNETAEEFYKIVRRRFL